MYPLKRIAAYAIDMLIAFAPVFLLTEFGEGVLDTEFRLVFS